MYGGTAYYWIENCPLFFYEDVPTKKNFKNKRTSVSGKHSYIWVLEF